MVRGPKKVENHWSNGLIKSAECAWPQKNLNKSMLFFFNVLLFFSARLSLFY